MIEKQSAYDHLKLSTIYFSYPRYRKIDGLSKEYKKFRNKCNFYFSVFHFSVLAIFDVIAKKD